MGSMSPRRLRGSNPVPFMITTEQVKDLRDATGISVMQCKKALEEAGGDTEKALVILRKKSSAIAEKKADRALGAGVVASYIHGNRSVGAMVLLSCETDFVAKNEAFSALAYELAMQVAATAPKFLKKADVTEEASASARAVFEKEAEGKPADMREKIVAGKLDSYFKDQVLLEQDYIKDPARTVRNLIEEATQKFGENIDVTKFVRFSTR